MKLKTLLENPKLANAGLDLTKFGEATLAAIENLEVDDTEGETITSNLNKGLLTRLEAENDATISAKHKDLWHKEARKGVLDSIDSSIKEYENILTDSELVEYQALDTVKKSKYLMKKHNENLLELKSKIDNADTAGEKKALEKALEDYKLQVGKDYIPKSEIETMTKEVGELKKTLDKFEKVTIKNEIISSAIKSGKLNSTIAGYDVDIQEGMVQSAVNKYLETEVFGENTKAKVIINKSTGSVLVRQAGVTEDLAIVEGTQTLTIQDIVERAIEKYGLTKKSDEKDEFQPTFGRKDNPKGLIADPNLVWN